MVEPNSLDPQQLVSASAEVQALLRSQGVMIETQRAQIADLTRQLEWFRRQVFGSKSERLAVLSDSRQLSLGELSGLPEKGAPGKTRTVAAHTRRLAQRDAVSEAESVPFFDEARVPIETIELENCDIRGLAPDEFEVIAEKISY